MTLAAKAQICVIDDDQSHASMLAEALVGEGFAVRTFGSATEFLEACSGDCVCDLVITDLAMPGPSGLDLCRHLRKEPCGRGRVPVILLSGSDPLLERARGLDAGADDFVAKPYAWRDLLAKVRSLLNIRAGELNTLRALESTKRFVSPSVASMVAKDGASGLLRPHRAEVTVLFVDLRRFTPFSEKHEPEEVLEVLGAYYTAVGAAALRHGGTLGHLAGDGIMVFFNDPEPVPDHREVAVQVALEAREDLGAHRRLWREREYDIDLGFGLSSGYATIGEIGFERFSQYSVIGTVTNVAARLCQAAGDGQILASHRFVSSLRECICDAHSIGDLRLKGLERAVSVYDIHSLERLKKVA